MSDRPKSNRKVEEFRSQPAIQTAFNARFQLVNFGVVACIVYLLLGLMATASVRAQSGKIGGVSNGDVVGIGVGLGAVGTGIGIGVYYAIHHNHALTGCAAVTPDGLRLQSANDGQAYALVGEIAAIRPGERVRVSGKKQKKDGVGAQLFLVDKLSKDLGSCTSQPTAH